MEDTVNMKTTGMDQLIKALKDKLPVARVGILGGRTIRADQKVGLNNATIGAVHEYGMGNMPQRSFLRVPITDHLQKRMESSGAFDKDVLNEVISTGTIKPWVKKMAILAEGIVMEAFETGGFGKWPLWKTPGYHNKGNRILVDTTQLRESITSEVK